jgi:ribonuclease HI
MEKRNAIIYVDGSYNPNTRVIGCGVALFDGVSNRPHRLAFNKLLKSQAKYGSCIAEMTATKTAIKTARSLGFTHIDIFHDWNGVDHFSYRDNIKKRHFLCRSFASYADFVEEARKYLMINFIKVKAHSGNKLNNLVDKMAKAGKAN